jgi:transcriptional regulator with XRE-family HTH domain
VATTRRQDLHLGRQIGDIVREARLECGWSQREMARRLVVPQSAIARLESGRREHLDVSLASTALELLGVRLSFDSRTLGLAGRREQRDRVHAACASSTQRRLGVFGWDSGVEVEVGDGRGRGWIDLLAYRPADRALLLVEVRTELIDVGGILRTVDWYQRAAWAAARQRGWRPRQQSTLLVVLDTVENDARIRANAALLGNAFPDRGAAAMTLVRAPFAPAIRAVGQVDPRSRRSAWLRSSRLQGRRSPSAYLDYRDAARRIDRR